MQAPFLGLLTEAIPEKDPLAGSGVRVLTVLPTSPAAEAGVLEGDIVVAVANRPVSDPAGYLKESAALPFDARVSLSLVRDGKATSTIVRPRRDCVLTALTATTAVAVVDRAYIEIRFPASSRPAASRPSAPPASAAPAPGFLGVQVADNPSGPTLEEQGLPRGALVRDVIPGSAAQAAGMVPGDVITWVSGRPVNGAVDLTALVSSIPSGNDVALVVQRGEQQLSLTATLTPRGGG